MLTSGPQTENHQNVSEPYTLHGSGFGSCWLVKHSQTKDKVCAQWSSRSHPSMYDFLP